MRIKFTISILSFFIFSSVFPQDEITYEKTLNEIKKSSKTLATNLIIPDKKNSIGIYTKNWNIEDLSIEQCGDIKTDSIKNSKIIKILQANKLLTKLYINLENNEYESINTSDKFEWKSVNLIIELSFNHNQKNMIDKIYIPIKTKKQAKKLIKSFCIYSNTTIVSKS